jgi:hypothetical protein
MPQIRDGQIAPRDADRRAASVGQAASATDSEVTTPSTGASMAMVSMVSRKRRQREPPLGSDHWFLYIALPGPP